MRPGSTACSPRPANAVGQRLDEDGQASAGWTHARSMLERAERREPLLRTEQAAVVVADSRAEFAETERR